MSGEKEESILFRCITVWIIASLLITLFCWGQYIEIPTSIIIGGIGGTIIFVLWFLWKLGNRILGTSKVNDSPS